MKGSNESARRGGELQLEAVSASVAAAHELKSPLVLIRQLALAAAETDLDDTERQGMLGRLVMVADRGLRLTTDLTRTTRLNEALFEVEPVNAQQLCEAIVQQITPLYQQHGRSISFTARRPRPVVLAHRELLASIVYHFADNALHYGDAGSSVSVSLTSRVADKTLRIGVRDKGPALSRREWRQARQRTGSKLAARPQSSGLGLYISEQFSQAMGGELGLVQHRDGATFYVDVPVSEQLSLL